MSVRPILLVLALACGASAQPNYSDTPESGDDSITAHDGRGGVSLVYNVFDGRAHSIQVSRLNARGVIWTDQHYDGAYEKAYAAAMDKDSNLFVVGIRRVDRQKYFLLLRYEPNGYLSRETVDRQFDCTAVGVAVDSRGGVVLTGVCRNGNYFPARVVKYDNQLNFLWEREYDGGGRNYVRALQIDPEDNVDLTIETIYGNYRDGAYQTRRVIYDPDGRQLAIR